MEEGKLQQRIVFRQAEQPGTEPRAGAKEGEGG